MSKYKDYFTTYNISLSAVLVAFGFKLEKIEKGMGSKSLFYFLNTSELQDHNQKYWRKELTLEPQLLFDSLKFLKNRLYSSFEDGNDF